MIRPTPRKSDGRVTRRNLLGFAAAAVPLVLASCAATSSSERLATPVDSFEVAYADTRHRCLYASAGDLTRGDATAIILLHGAGQTGSQWFRFGLADALHRLDRTTAATARNLRDSEIDLTEHLWAGEHDEGYWAAHIDDYLAFHLAA